MGLHILESLSLLEVDAEDFVFLQKWASADRQSRREGSGGDLECEGVHLDGWSCLGWS